MCDATSGSQQEGRYRSNKPCTLPAFNQVDLLSGDLLEIHARETATHKVILRGFFRPSSGDQIYKRVANDTAPNGESENQPSRQRNPGQPFCSLRIKYFLWFRIISCLLAKDGSLSFVNSKKVSFFLSPPRKTTRIAIGVSEYIEPATNHLRIKLGKTLSNKCENLWEKRLLRCSRLKMTTPTS